MDEIAHHYHLDYVDFSGIMSDLIYIKFFDEMFMSHNEKIVHLWVNPFQVAYKQGL